MKATAIMITFCGFGLASCTTATPTALPDKASAPTVSATMSSSSEPVPETSSSNTDEATEISDQASASSECASFVQNNLEVCTAYTFNASLEARLSYYKLGRSTAVGYYKAVQERCTGKSAGAAADCRFQSRYYEGALRDLQLQAQSWPAEVNVDFPRIKIVSVDANVAANSATLSTVESWSVHTRAGESLFIETGAKHTITMQRVQGLVLHKWVVTSIR